MHRACRLALVSGALLSLALSVPAHAQSRSGMGGGFIEFLFSDGGGEPAAPSYGERRDHYTPLYDGGTIGPE